MPGQTADTPPLVLAIIGSGPRGLSVLERLAVRLTAEAEAARAADGRPPRPVRIHLVDASEIGAGRVWRTDQDPWFTMNTVISQVTMYSGDPDGGPARPGAGPSLGQWIEERARLGEEPLGPDDYAPRVRYGRYLADVYATVARALPDHAELVPTTGRVVSVRPAPGGGQLVRLAGAPRPLPADRVVLATGHPVNAPDAFEREMLGFAARFPGLRYLHGDSAADLELDEETVPPGSPVGVRGLGLCFYDVMLALTVGRGGVFAPDEGGELVYRPSGREPRIVAGSRSGLPIPARGRNQKAPSYSHRARFLTPAALARARENRRAATGSGQLDFAADVLPLLVQEVTYVHAVTTVRAERGRAAAEEFARTYTHEAGAEAAPIDLRALARPFEGESFPSPDAFRRRLLRAMDDDLAEAARGTVDGPLKAALDVLRDIRNTVREAVDHGGLLPDSHRDDFHGAFLPLNALLSAGPPAGRVEQLRALIRQGVVEVAGPETVFGTDEAAGVFQVVSPRVAGSARRVTTVVDARIPGPDLLQDTSELTRQLVRDGMARPWVIGGPDGRRLVTGGLEVTRAPFRVVAADGRPQPDLYALGIPTEHTRWFTQVGSSRPGVATLFYRDADAVAADVLRPAPAPAPAPATGPAPAAPQAPAALPVRRAASRRRTPLGAPVRQGEPA
ncbi:FAD/NAD(P)-binding protein [Streptomyces sp. NPDC000594]|uniref:FAD/NAD(P)-binding protein n=1 Tax=Streptomyces sp. NPDC000594 TaxID=3154261 RepID=UPI0033318504